MHVRVGGVPEHFNYSWYKAIAQGKFQAHELDIDWTDYPGGTGAMAQALTEGQLDMAVMLTEGAVSAIAKGCPARILHFAVQSPLLWGIHTGFSSALQHQDDSQGKTFAISRYGSGSHLMAIVHAYLKGWPLDHMRWLEVKNLAGAKEALIAGKADVFLWERYMTKPLVDEGSFRLLGVLPTPWPAFVLAVHDDFMSKYPDAVDRISQVILTTQTSLKEEEGLAQTLSIRYHLEEEDVSSWLTQTRWSTRNQLSEQEINEVIVALVKAGVLNQEVKARNLLAQKGL
jgi:sulfonate transport system substrate-binding protein